MNINKRFLATNLTLLLALGFYATAQAAHEFVHFFQSSHFHRHFSTDEGHAHEHSSDHNHVIVVLEIPTGIVPGRLEIPPDLNSRHAFALQNFVRCASPDLSDGILIGKDPPVLKTFSYLDLSLTTRAPPA